MEILRGWGSRRPKFCKESKGLKWEFQRGGLNQKTFSGRGMDIFWNSTLFIVSYSLTNFETKENKNQTG